jgi:hypothetical protein
VKDENGDVLAESNVSQLLNVHGISDVRQIEVHAAEALLHDSSPSEVQIAIAKLKR